MWTTGGFAGIGEPPKPKATSGRDGDGFADVGSGGPKRNDPAGDEGSTGAANGLGEVAASIVVGVIVLDEEGRDNKSGVEVPSVGVCCFFPRFAALNASSDSDSSGDVSSDSFPFPLPQSPLPVFLSACPKRNFSPSNFDVEKSSRIADDGLAS